MRAKKSLGQNFLMHARIAERIADVAGLTKESRVLEIGPGTGMLTRPLLMRAKRVIAVEADHELVRKLEETFPEAIREGRLVLVSGDIRSFDLSTMPERYTLVANIPYYITGEILRTFLSARRKPESMTLLVQKEVAERIVARKPARGGSASGGKESLLSLSVKAYGAPAYRFTVPRGAFLPAPSVDSAVLSVTGIRQDAFASEHEEKRFFEALHAGFAHKRKLLIRNLEAVAPAEQIRAAFRSAEIPEKARAEDLSLAAWRRLTENLSG